jgi:3'(2'), 5'-bisphosphate nucleotidase
MDFDLKQYVTLIIDASRDAGIEILEIYNKDVIDVEEKENHTPLTKADTNAHQIIKERLKETEIPVLSEEGAKIPYSDRKNWETFWMVDPLDGTKEFIKKNGEFTVNIALIHKNKPILGALYAPVLDELYFGGPEIGAFNAENMDPQHKMELIKNESGKTIIVASRSHLNDETKAFIDQYDNAEIVSMGSSLKFMLVADSQADIYPRFAPTMEWDTAAAHAILRGLDLEVMSMEDDKPLRYNKEDLHNPHFIVKRAKD